MKIGSHSQQLKWSMGTLKGGGGESVNTTTPGIENKGLDGNCYCCTWKDLNVSLKRFVSFAQFHAPPVVECSFV